VTGCEPAVVSDGLLGGGSAEPLGVDEAEHEVYVAAECEGAAVRELARETDRRPGTVGNLLKRARLRLADREEEVSKTW